MRLLVIEDDEKIRAFLDKGLRQEGHTVDTASNGREGLALWEGNRYDAVILDLMLPERDGIAILRHMRNKSDQTPVLILSAKGTVNERVAGLQHGADDYMVKPFSLSELAARIEAVTRRSQTPHKTVGRHATTLSVGGVTLDLLRRVAIRDDRRIELKPREFALLELLMRQPDRPLTKATILGKIWDYDFDPQTNIVDVLICRLRNKIDSDFETKRIQTLRGVGYVFRTGE